jgi:cell division protein FtsI (penicillin-binding protein 3)
MDGARSRFSFMIGMLLLAFVAVEARLFFLQIRKHPERAAEAKETYYKNERILAARGSILMRNSYSLAESVPAVKIWADSNWTARKNDEFDPTQRDRIAAAIEEALGHEIENLRAELDKPGYRLIATEAIHGGARKQQPSIVGDGVRRLLELKREGQLPGITIETTWIRSYPDGDLAAGVAGYVDTDGKGRAGIELAFDSDLRGVEGRRTLMRDAAGRPIYDVGCESIAPTPGHDVHLTLDVVIQYYLEEALAKAFESHRPKWAAGVVLDPRTGEVLAMASLPSFDPNQYSNYDIANHQNRCVTYTYTPGSTFKPFMMAASIEWTNLSPRAIYDCSSYSIDGRSISDAHRHSKLTVSEIMAESSNIGMCKVVMRMCPDGLSREKQTAAFTRIRDLLTDLGFGKRLEVGLPGESAGKLAGVSSWSRRYTLASLAFGHEIAVTPLQLAAAFSVFGNDGQYVKPYLIERVVAHDGTIVRKHVPESHTVFTRSTVDKIREMLVSVVDEGTGTKASITGYTVAGKTSTAQWENDPRKYSSSFVGFAPARDPRLLVSIVIDQPTRNGHYGGVVAAPAARDVLERSLPYLRVPRDRND